MTTGTMESCTCAQCVGCCEFKPGWFMPDEIAPLAAAMGLTEQELFDRHLMIDAWYAESDEEHDIFLLAPVTVEGTPGGYYPSPSRGQCAFLVDGLCSIHEKGKPFECRHTWHGVDNSDEIHTRQIPQAWDTPEQQERIAALLGRPLERQDVDLVTALETLFEGFFQ